MTTYSIKNSKNEVTVEISGHSGYAEYGNDIVCAAISTACIMTANLIDKIGSIRYNILDLVCEEGYFRLQVKLADSVTIGIIENFCETLDSLQKQYPKYIKIKS
jgi:uncharacterized protein YsxB (DUF464 family)